MQYNLNGKISLDDYIQFNKFHLKHSFLGKFSVIFYPIILIVIAVSIFPNIEILLSMNPLDWIPYVILLMICIVFWVLFNLLGMPVIYKRNYRANKSLQELQNIIINEDCILLSTENSNMKLTKEHINKIQYDKDSVYIYTGLNIGHILKKDFLKTKKILTKW